MALTSSKKTKFYEIVAQCGKATTKKRFSIGPMGLIGLMFFIWACCVF